MVGTETGRLVSCARKAKTDTDRINVVYPGHAGPIHALERHPFFNKTFLSAADWTVRIWSEEIRDDYILSTRSVTGAMEIDSRTRWFFVDLESIS